MATTITNLNTVPGYYEGNWAFNITATDISTAADIKPAVSNIQYGVSGITVVALTSGTQWFRLLDGESPFIGPIVLASGIPWSRTFDPPICCTKDNALKIQTQSAFGIHCMISGITGSYPEKATNPSPADEATSIALTSSLTWETSGNVSYSGVYFGTSGSPVFIKNQSATTYWPTMAYDTTYYWRIDTTDGGSTTEGDVWSFTTEPEPEPE